MNNKPVILITGATGNTGSAVARHVIRSAPKEYHIRLASHNENKLKNLFGKESNVELIRMDFKDKTSVRGALKNVERVWVTAPRPDKTMKQFDRIRWVNDFVDECKQLGSIKMLVFGSSYGAESDSTILGKEFRMAEKKIEQSGIPHCFLRLGPMIDILLALKDVTINKGMYPMLNGNTKMCPLWSYDIGRCAATVLLNPDPYRGKSYFLTGPEPITVEEQGRILSKVLHRQLNYQTVDRKQMVEYLKSTAPEYMAEGVVEWTELAAKSSVFATPSQDIKTLTGQPGTRYEDAIKSMQTAGLFDTTPA